MKAAARDCGCRENDVPPVCSFTLTYVSSSGKTELCEDRNRSRTQDSNPDRSQPEVGTAVMFFCEDMLKTRPSWTRCGLVAVDSLWTSCGLAVDLLWTCCGTRCGLRCGPPVDLLWTCCGPAVDDCWAS
ncbi:hypothetical protein WMY93_007913 [Mugilogobius chulae]|uniref:Uncharacterized protein n=1 Tax=Mugilogobius chulae TaxID=88201 RepID=A0AAW0PN61_9GOBI